MLITKIFNPSDMKKLFSHDKTGTGEKFSISGNFGQKVDLSRHRIAGTNVDNLECTAC